MVFRQLLVFVMTFLMTRTYVHAHVDPHFQECQEPQQQHQHQHVDVAAAAYIRCIERCTVIKPTNDEWYNPYTTKEYVEL